MKGYRIGYRSVLCSLLGLLIFAVGCREDQIETYRVARLEPAKADNGRQPSMSASAPSDRQSPSRIVAAIAQRPDAMWVFKIVGAPEAMSATEAAWRKFLEQIAFRDDNLPHWDVPEGWSELPGNDFRHATLVIPSVEPPLEIAVSRLPPGQDLLMNVNRWRGQLNLDPLQPDQLDDQWGKITAGSETLLLFDASGVSAESPPGGGPMSIGAPAALPAAADTSAPPRKETELPFEFTPPANWEPGLTTQFTLRRYVKTAGERSIQLAITRLQAAGQSWADNVGVWSGELGMEKPTAEQVAAQTKELSIDGRSAQSIALKSPPEAGKASRIVSWSDGADSWFIKLTGDVDLIDESDAEFEQVLKSIRFSPDRQLNR